METKTDDEQGCQFLTCPVCADDPRTEDAAHNLQSLPAEGAAISDRQAHLTVPSDSQDRWDFLLLLQIPSSVSRTQVSDPLFKHARLAGAFKRLVTYAKC